MRKRTEALVVGAGPVGLFTTLSLARRGVEVAVIDREWRKAAHSYALALHPASLELLSEYGLAKEIVDAGYRVDRLSFWDGKEERAAVDFGVLATPWPFLLIMPQNAVEGALEATLSEHGVPVHWSHALADLDVSGERPVAVIERREKVSSGYASATTDWIVEKENRVEADFVAGTDGNRSLVRRRLGIPWEEFHEPEYYAVFEFETDWEAKNEARILLAPSGERHVFWPLPGGRCRASFLLSDPEAAVREREKSRLTIQLGGVGYPHLRESTLLRLLDEQAPWFGGGVKEVKWSMIVRFEQRLAHQFGDGRVWLAGDSAHLAGPIGVASMNIGFREGDDLARRAHEVVRGGLTPTRFEEYGRERQEEWKEILLPGGGFHAGSGASDFVRENAEILPSLLPASGEQLRTLAGQLGLETGR